MRGWARVAIIAQVVGQASLWAKGGRQLRDVVLAFEDDPRAGRVARARASAEASAAGGRRITGVLHTVAHDACIPQAVEEGWVVARRGGDQRESGEEGTAAQHRRGRRRTLVAATLAQQLRGAPSTCLFYI